MSTNPRSQIIMPSDIVELYAQFYDGYGNPSDTDSFPQITIVQPNGSVVIGPTSAGVFKADVGLYGFRYQISLSPQVGVWSDVWRGAVNGFVDIQERNFIVYTSQTPAINSDGYVHLGDDPGFNYSQNAIRNINNLIKSLRVRLNSSGKHKTKDEFGNDIYVSCDIFNTDQLVSFLAMALAEFNAIPMFTLFTFDETPIIQNFHSILVQGATIMALSSQAIIERGREFNINDNGLGFTPPTVSEILNSQYSTELTNWTEKVKIIKANMRAAPHALGSFSGVNAGGTMTRIKVLGKLRGRQIF